MADIALVGCGDEKKLEGAPAKDLYTGDYFRKKRAFAEKHADAWYILSARHGLVHPETFLHWYDTSMKSLTRIEREVWEMDVRRDIRRLVGPRDRIVFLAGEDYVGAVSGMPRVERPLQGLGIGQQKQWLKLNT